MPGGFVVSDASLSSADLGTSLLTLRFRDGNVERDYMRFRVSRARVCVSAITALGSALTLLRLYRTSGNASDATALAVGGAVLVAAFLFDLVFVAFRSPVAHDTQANVAILHERISSTGDALGWGIALAGFVCQNVVRSESS